MNILLTLACLALLIGAALTTKPVTIWQPAEAPVIQVTPASLPTQPMIEPPLGAVPTPVVAATVTSSADFVAREFPATASTVRNVERVSRRTDK